MKNMLIALDKLIHWRQWLIRHNLFDVLDFTLLANTDTYHDLPARIKEEWRAAGSYREFVNIHHALQLTANLPGDVAELGACRGGVSKLIALACPDKPIHLFDTWTGIPHQDKRYDGDEVGKYAADLDEVKEYLKDFKNITFYPGVFPETAKDLKNTWSFVYMDLVQYQSTLDALEYFYPKLAHGGIMISHDYSSKNCDGVKQAFKDYTAKHEFFYFPVWDCSVMAVKI